MTVLLETLGMRQGLVCLANTLPTLTRSVWLTASKPTLRLQRDPHLKLCCSLQRQTVPGAVTCGCRPVSVRHLAGGSEKTFQDHVPASSAGSTSWCQALGMGQSQMCSAEGRGVCNNRWPAWFPSSRSSQDLLCH